MKNQLRLLSPAAPKTFLLFLVALLSICWGSSQAHAALNPPKNLTAVAASEKVTLTFEYSAGATSYLLKRGVSSGGPYITVNTTTTKTVVDEDGLTNGYVYYYVVTASNGTQESSNSNEVSVRVGPPVTVEKWDFAQDGLESCIAGVRQASSGYELRQDFPLKGFHIGILRGGQTATIKVSFWDNPVGGPIADYYSLYSLNVWRWDTLVGKAAISSSLWYSSVNPCTTITGSLRAPDYFSGGPSDYTMELNVSNPQPVVGFDPPGGYTISNAFDFKVRWQDGSLPTSPDLNITAPVNNEIITTWPFVSCSTETPLPGIAGTIKSLNGAQNDNVKVVLSRDSDCAFWSGTAWIKNKVSLNAVLCGNPTSDGTTTWICVNMPVGSDLVPGSYTIVALAQDKLRQVTEVTTHVRVDPSLPTPTPIP